MTRPLIRVAFHTLGCKLNFAETSTIARSLPSDRFMRVPFGEEADVYIINTCSVTSVADRKCRQVISKVSNRHPEAFIAVVGCYAQLRPAELAALTGVNLILGTNEKFDIAAYIENISRKEVPEIHSCGIESSVAFSPSWSLGDRTRSFLKVQDGCDYGCSYCTIPLARGRSRNLPVAECVMEAEKIAAAGVKEIVLTGVNTGDFGKTTGESFLMLLNALLKVEGIERYRISSIEPNLLDDEIIEMAASGGPLMPHFHIPLQSGCNRTLAAMRRRYTRELFASRVEKIRKLIPLAGIGADIITGFPGESQADHSETLSFISSLPLSYLHVFRYSPRPGTVAANLAGRISAKDQEKRSHELMKLSESKKMAFYRLNTGRVDKVLFESTESGKPATGFTQNYIRVNVPAGADIKGEMREVLLKGMSEGGEMWGEIVQG